MRFFTLSASVSLLLLLASSPSVTSLWANTVSPCAASCGNSLGATLGSDIVCDDANYVAGYNGGAGVTFQSCLTCQLSSTYVDPTTQISDLEMGLCM